MVRGHLDLLKLLLTAAYGGATAAKRRHELQRRCILQGATDGAARRGTLAWRQRRWCHGGAKASVALLVLSGATSAYRGEPRVARRGARRGAAHMARLGGGTAGGANAWRGTLRRCKGFGGATSAYRAPTLGRHR